MCMEPADGGITDSNVDRVTVKVNAGELGRRNSEGSYSPSSASPALLRRKYAKAAFDFLI